MLQKNHGFTLLELLVSITLLGIIIVGVFQLIANISAERMFVTDRLNMNKDLYFTIERFVTLVKEGGSIDYEEYWARKAPANINGYQVCQESDATCNTENMFGFYQHFTEYGNSGTHTANNNNNSPYYYCFSSAPNFMDGTGCANMSNGLQRYGQYVLQFMDFNSNGDGDTCESGDTFGDEDCDGSILFDDDDEDLGRGPGVLPIDPISGEIQPVRELYLIKKGVHAQNQRGERLYFRWVISEDQNRKPVGYTCVLNNITQKPETLLHGAHLPAGDKTDVCHGRLQMLRLEAGDFGYDHDVNGGSDSGQYDRNIDTWYCHEDYQCSTQITGINGSEYIPKNIHDGWIDVFPSYINVKNLEFYIYPEKDSMLAWAEKSKVSPYVRIVITTGFSWERKVRFSGRDPEVSFSTTIDLLD